MVFSWIQEIKDAKKVKQRRARTMAISGANPDFSIKHPDWVRDAKQKNFTAMDKKIGEEFDKQQERLKRRVEKYARKN